MDLGDRTALLRFDLERNDLLEGELSHGDSNRLQLPLGRRAVALSVLQTAEVGPPRIELGAMLPVNLLVTFLVIGLGAVAFISGVRRKFPKYCSFLGYTRFSNYFMIAIFPLQARYLEWTWDRLIAIVLFAVPIWLVLHFGLM